MAAQTNDWLLKCQTNSSREIAMLETIKKPIQKALYKAGYDVHRRKPDELSTLKPYTFRTILDIGANEGQFARRVRRIYPGAMIHSFEPIGVPYEVLSRSLATDPLFQAHRVALGDASGTVEMYENHQSDFSSMLPMTSTCRQNFPVAENETLTRVKMMSLDEWAETQILEDPLLLKIDVQGYEDRVIRGGIDTVRKASVILTEVSFRPLYRHQALFHDLYQLLHSLGFDLMAIVNNMYDVSENIVQADAIFEKSGVRTKTWSSNEAESVVAF
jgi:FkbM family methyltransferase